MINADLQMNNGRFDRVLFPHLGKVLVVCPWTLEMRR